MGVLSHHWRLKAIIAGWIPSVQVQLDCVLAALRRTALIKKTMADQVRDTFGEQSLANASGVEEK
jgi:hypothetical protein